MDFITINTLFSKNYYAVPDYQRDYEWTNAQNTTLLDDVFAVVEDKNSNYHFVGAIVTVPYENDNGTNCVIDYEDYDISPKSIKHLVDGQQRLTSLSLLLQAVYDNLNEDDDVDDQFKSNHLNIITNILSDALNWDSSGNPAPRLWLNGNTGACYVTQILKIKSLPFSKIYRGAWRMLKAYDLYSDGIKSKKKDLLGRQVFADVTSFYKELIGALTKKIVFAEIDCDDSANAFQVFDSLNGKGLDLTAADRIKNIMLSWSQPGKGAQKWDALAQEVGEEYLPDFFVSLFFYHEKKRISKNKLPERFRDTYKNSAQTDFDYFYNELKDKGILYGKLRRARTGNEKINGVLQDIQALGFVQALNILYAAAYHYKVDFSKGNDYYQFAYALLSLLVRMQVGDISTNRLDPEFSALIEMMKEQSASLKTITQALDKKRKLLIPDDQFEMAFGRFCPHKNDVSEVYCRYLENYCQKENGSRTRVEKGLTVEHIIPQTLDDLGDWYGDTSIPDEVRENFQSSVIDSIGNKMLLYGDDNSSANNNDYKSKTEVYLNGKRGQDNGTPIGTFVMVKSLLEKYPTRFNHEEVNSRAEELAKLALNIW